jgi:hypothetical protein
VYARLKIGFLKPQGRSSIERTPMKRNSASHDELFYGTIAIPSNICPFSRINFTILLYNTLCIMKFLRLQQNKVSGTTIVALEIIRSNFQHE